MSKTPKQLMRRAIELSRHGFPSPNPHVGCVIAVDGEMVGKGFHDHAGGPHAEVVALEQAGPKARGADVYVTLEPCNHQGRTPPCSNALIAAGVASVTAATLDPNPKAAGGLAVLSEAGIQVSSGLLESEARAANEMFMTAMESGRPFVVGKVAMSLDGRVALPNGESKWITSETSRMEGHRLRAECGAVLVGRNTVVRDDPVLTARLDGVVNQPIRIVLDPNSALSGLEKVFGHDAPTWHVTKHPLRENQIEAPMKEDRLDLLALLKDFHKRGVTGLLVEGGPITLGHFLKAGLIDRLEVFIAPKALGAGPSWLGVGVDSLANAYQFKVKVAKQLEDDLWISYRPLPKSET